MSRHKLSGLDAFEAHFSEIYGSRWPDLRASLLNDERQVLRPNGFTESDAAVFGPWREAGSDPTSPRSEDGLLRWYVMDAASVVAARALEIRPGQRVLDLCAAPGGKTLVLAEALFLEGDLTGELIANEPSASRRERLTKVVQQYVPRETRERIFTRGLDGVQFGLREPESFDRILVDAPCSGERHLLKNPEELAEWGPRRTEHLAHRQYALLAAAWLALKPGGRIVYSTCSISPEENDGVVGKLIKKKKAMKAEFPSDLFAERTELRAGMEATQHGALFLPDREGLGPIFFSLLEKP